MSSSSPDTPFEVAIIGAGASGLCAAQELLRLSSCASSGDLVLLDSLDYAGGRMRTVPLDVAASPSSTPASTSASASASSAVMVEAGAEFVHGSTTLLNYLVKAKEWPTKEVFVAAQGDGGPDSRPTPEGKHGVYYLGREKRLLRYDDSSDPDFKLLNLKISEIRRHDEARSSASVGEHLSSSMPPPSWERMLDLAVAGYGNTIGAANLDDISLQRMAESERWWDDHDGCSSPDGGGDCRLDDGRYMSDVAGELASGLEKSLRLNFRVKTLDYSASVCRIVGSDGEAIWAKKVIVTIPTNQFAAVDFCPPLPKAKQTAATLIGFSNAVKLFVVLEERFWPDAVSNVIAASSKIPEMWFRYCPLSKVHIVCCFACSDFACELERMGEDKAVDEAVALLSEIFGSSADLIESKVLETKLFSWGAVPSIGGGYSYPKKGLTRKHISNLARPIDGKIYFAGEATHQGAGSTVHAAMETGVRAAKEIQQQQMQEQKRREKSQAVLWPLSRLVPTSFELDLLPLLIKKRREYFMIHQHPRARVNAIALACSRLGIPLSTALSLRRQHIKNNNRFVADHILGLGSLEQKLAAANAFEVVVAGFLRRNGIEFVDEEQQRIIRPPTPGQYHPGTPDFLFFPPLRVEVPKGEGPRKRNTGTAYHTLNWLEVKHFYGASTIPTDGKSACGKLPTKAAQYVRNFGTGGYLFAYGCGEDLQRKLPDGCVILDESVLDLGHLCDVLITQGFANSRGEILP